MKYTLVDDNGNLLGRSTRLMDSSLGGESLEKTPGDLRAHQEGAGSSWEAGRERSPNNSA
jgi:hypothetical protein